MSSVYQLIIAIYFTLIRIASLFNRKAEAWVKGRRGWKARLKSAFADSDKVAWFHAASLGEFEQGRPVIENFRKEYPDYKILLTFFSPSGYEQKKNYQGADVVMYLPSDCKSNARYFVAELKPDIAIFIKYEFWFNYIKVLNERRIPVLFISALFREKQLFFKWYGAWFRKRLKQINHFFVQDKASAKLLDDIGIKQVSISGDTRFDRVADILNNKMDNPEISSFCQGHRVLLAGSTWPPDEDLLATLPEQFPDLKIIIAPHEIKEERIQQLIETMGSKAARYTLDDPSAWSERQLLIIDTIGVLSSIYRYADIAYIGGAFATGLHNIQEPAINGIPVIFGPKFQKFREAVDLVEQGGAFTIGSTEEFQDVMKRLLTDDDAYNRAGNTCKQYMIANTGATKKIMEGTRKFL